MSTALWLAAICQGFLALVDLWQDRLLYFPQRATVEEVAIAGLTPWPSARDFRGLVLITPWGRLAQVASHHYPWLPVKWLLRDPYDTAARLARLDRPMVVIVAEQDSIVPARFGGALNAAPDGPKYLMQIEGAGHNDWPGRVDATWWRTATGPAP